MEIDRRLSVIRQVTLSDHELLPVLIFQMVTVFTFYVFPWTPYTYDPIIFFSPCIMAYISIHVSHMGLQPLHKRK